MHFRHLLSALFVAAASVMAQDIVYDAEHNATVIVGSWASGSKNVKTGLEFANPANMSFTYPTTSGVAYAFSADGWYEISRYRFNSNGSQPNCITGVLGWVHGTYQLLGNGSIVMTPNGDGYQQIQDACAAVSNFVEVYNFTELYQSWRIFTDPTDGYKLHLFQFDGTPVAPLFQVSTQPIMLPTTKLRNDTLADPSSGTEVLNQKRSQNAAVANRWSSAGAVLSLVLAAGLLAIVA
ncbi:chaperone for protein-folding within the ER, fungal-domain-containing protein [Amylostereum chailletii]|nr:chaperone for protein-folding within the ER, fungal-domain-containing protein [Amylostereum chailletii]